MVDKLKIESIAASGNAATTFVAMLNPNSIKHGFGIGYTDDPCKHQQAQGDIAPTVQFQGYQSEKLDFEIMIDATGVVEYKKGKSVQDQLTLLKKVAYAYNGKQHEPNPVKISWGTTLSFRGRLTSMAVSYVLFDSSGVPLRATVSLSFTQFLTEKEKEALAKKSSPDLTHHVIFKAGDTLPGLCHQIYNDSSYYPKVAAFNKLPSIRNINPGTRLYFPPLSQ
ncbi:peptidoglycan-binding protein [Vibrio parahaemolyticus]|uniref:CIS tube protein n=1 Tax=Vibrio mediterranei TaxID=689 RepID=UPI00406784C6